MKIESVEGIVLTDINYSESSKILNVLTKEYGLIGIISKGARNIKSKLRSVSRKLVYGKFNIYYKENGLSTLISVDVINSYNNILTNLDNITFASFLLELTYQVVKENDDEAIYDILKQSLQKIDEGYDANAISCIVELKYLDYLGVKPNIDGCSICGSSKNIVTLSVDLGGFVCNNCYKEGYIVNDIAIKLIRMFYYVDIEKISKLDIKRENLKEINFFLSEYYDKYTGIYLKSKKMLEKITNFVES